MHVYTRSRTRVSGPGPRVSRVDQGAEPGSPDLHTVLRLPRRSKEGRVFVCTVDKKQEKGKETG